jgi:hypothetical protein
VRKALPGSSCLICFEEAKLQPGRILHVRPILVPAYLPLEQILRLILDCLLWNLRRKDRHQKGQTEKRQRIQ